MLLRGAKLFWLSSETELVTHIIITVWYCCSISDYVDVFRWDQYICDSSMLFLTFTLWATSKLARFLGGTKYGAIPGVLLNWATINIYFQAFAIDRGICTQEMIYFWYCRVVPGKGLVRYRRRRPIRHVLVYLHKPLLSRQAAAVLCGCQEMSHLSW